MSEQLNLKEIRRQVYLSYTEDGLIDLSIGLLILGFAAMLMADLPWMVGLLGGIPLLIWYGGKRSLTLPRIGSIQPGKEMKDQFKGYTIALLIAGLGVLVFFILLASSGRSILADHPLALFGLVLALGISALAILTKAYRLYLYAALVFAAMTIGEILNRSIETLDMFLLLVFIAGAVIIIAGIIVLSTFLRKYPIVSLDE